jgi:choline dehydrogenase-like flavoprotein
MTDTLTTRILFTGSRATGVETERFGELMEFRADREVILSAGAYNSPQLLMLSGVGPAEELQPLEIRTVAELPVGQNLQDHPAVLLNMLVSMESLFADVRKPESLTLLQSEGRGPLTSNYAETGAFWRTREGATAPEIQYHAVPAMFTDQGLALPTDHAVAAGPCLLKPRSRGRVALRTPDPTSKPRILHNYYDDPDDLDVMVRGVHKAMEIFEQPALKEVARGKVEPYPRSGDDADVRQYLRRATQTTFHPVATCAMGSVVDSELRVFGFDGLRVVDASVMPTIVRGNTNAPTIMIAEKAADLILGRKAAAAMTTA